MTYVGAIDLNANEKELFDKITLEPRPHDESASVTNRDAVPKLMDFLERRGAIPRHRLEYFTDPQMRSGKIKGSHKNLFERNGTTGKEIYEHCSFLKYLRYFVLGANLPSEVIYSLEQKSSAALQYHQMTYKTYGRRQRLL